MAIVGAGVLVLSPETLVIRLVSVDQWTILLWRGVLMGIGLLAFVAATSDEALGRRVVAVGRLGALAAALFAADNVLFVTSVTHTTAANTLAILSTSPLFAALFAAVFLRERVRRSAWVAMTVAAGAVALIVSEGLGRGAVGGDLAALGASMSIAGTLVVLRGSRVRNMLPSMALGALLGAAVASPFADPFGPSGGDALLLLLLGVVIGPVAFGLLATGPRYLQAAEVSLMILAEAVLGPLWVWLALGEVPGGRVLLGGGVLLVTLGVHFASEAARRPVGAVIP